MMHGTINIKLNAYSCICWLFHRIYYDARNHKHTQKKMTIVIYTGTQMKGDMSVIKLGENKTFDIEVQHDVI